MGGIVAVTVVVVIVLLFELLFTNDEAEEWGGDVVATAVVAIVLFEGAGDVNDVVKLLVCGDIVVAMATEAGGLDPPAPTE